MAEKLFLGSISMDSTPESIKAHFEKYGRVVDSVVITKDGIPRGFGFVTFEAEDAAAAALKDEHKLDGRSIDVKRASPKDSEDARSSGTGRGSGGGSRGKSDKVFVGGLPQDCADQKVIDYFRRYGTIVDAVVMKDRNTGRSRGFGFVRFDNTDSVDRVLEDYKDHRIEGKWCEVKSAVPQEQLPPPRADKFSNSGSTSSSGGDYGANSNAAYGGYGMGMAAMGGYGNPMMGYGYGNPMMGMYGNPMMGMPGYGYGGYPGAYGPFGDPYAQYAQAQASYGKGSEKGGSLGGYAPY